MNYENYANYANCETLASQPGYVTVSSVAVTARLWEGCPNNPRKEDLREVELEGYMAVT